MATTKKLAAKKTASKKKTLVKKLLPNKLQSKKIEPMKSFRLSHDNSPFLATRITKQTAYWTVLLVFIMIMQLWVLSIQLDIIRITDSISFVQ